MKRLLPLVPAALLCLVATTHLYLTRASGLTPWKGGGFGMFSTTDAGMREFHIRMVGSQGSEVIPLPEAAHPEAGIAGPYPSWGRLEALGRAILESERARGRSWDRVEIQILRTAYDVETMAPRLEVLREHVISHPGSP